MRRAVEKMLEKLKNDELVMIKVKYSRYEKEHVYVLNLFNDREVRGKRYEFRGSGEYSQSIVIARVMGSVRTRYVHVPEFVSDEEKLAVLWFMYVKESGRLLKIEEEE